MAKPITIEITWSHPIRVSPTSNVEPDHGASNRCGVAPHRFSINDPRANVSPIVTSSSGKWSTIGNGFTKFLIST